MADNSASVVAEGEKIGENLGDFHNFGKCTYLAADGRIIKPRSCTFEESFLSCQAPLRSLLERIFGAAGLRLPFPDLTFSPYGDAATAITRLQLVPAADLSAKDVESLGVAVAVAVFFGMSDLHRENIMTGCTVNGLFCFVPVDLECVLTPANSLHALSLVPGNGVIAAYAGLADVAGLCRASCRRDRNLPAVLAGAFCAAWMLLVAHQQENSTILSSMQPCPVRVVLRATDFYRSLLEQGGDAIARAGLLPAETEQLLRGDVPYFHTFVNETDLFWMDAPGKFARLGADRYLTVTGPLALPRWPGLINQPQIMQVCVIELLQFLLWDDHGDYVERIDATWSGVSVRSSDQGFCIESRGAYRPV